MIYDPSRHRLLIVVGSFTRTYGIQFYDLASGEVTQIDLDLNSFEGLPELTDIGNSGLPDLIPVAIDAEQLLVWSNGERSHFPENAPSAWRSYAVDLVTGKVDLVGFADAPFP